MVSIPLSRASCGEEKETRRWSSSISPLSSWKTPETAFIRVDLPAPLSPARATTSPGCTSSETPASACTPPKCLVALRTVRMGARSLNLAPSQKLALRLVDQHGNDDHRAHRDELPERLDIDEHQTILDDRDDEGAGDRPRDIARTAEQAGAADHNRGDGVEQQGLARLRRAGGEATGVERARDARHDRGEEIDLHRQRADVDAGATRRRLARAHRVSVLPELRLRKQIVHDQAGDRGQDDDHGDAEKT